eukprot:5504503-Karenia_brevis.AAC.1
MEDRGSSQHPKHLRKHLRHHRRHRRGHQHHQELLPDQFHLGMLVATDQARATAKGLDHGSSEMRLAFMDNCDHETPPQSGIRLSGMWLV